jgi:outer membrane translocation and assembly module TamA
MHNLAGPFEALVFLDAAGLESDIELAAGLGIRINLPVGPIRLEYGRSLSQNSEEPSGAFHFAIGTTF